jgi:hypothetical protein
MSAESKAEHPSTQLEDANLFTIAGPIAISYATSSFAGVPTLSYQDAELELSFSGDDITRTDSPVGELVTVTLENVADAFIRTFSILIPKIRLSFGDQVSFDTLGVETVDRTFAFTLPPGPSGVLQTYRSHQLHGDAQVVNF